MKGRVVLVTGATDGIGRETALALARMGATVLLHGRNVEKGEAALAQIRQATGSPNLESYAADFSSQKQVRALAEAVRRKHDRLHVLINNAGVYMNERRLTEDGLETTFAVNHLAPFLLTNLLLDLLKAGAPSRVIAVSSGTHQSGRIEWDNLQGEKRYEGYSAYARSKLANVLFANELAERLKGTGVTSNSLHPGVIATNLLRAGWRGGGASVQQGAQTPVYLASAPEVEKVTGQYFVNRQAVMPSASARDRALQAELWRVSEQLVGLRK
jgi:NAD(P)-dependent dehydrogenase (short-subunit alcohol dehydrogenase family)